MWKVYKSNHYVQEILISQHRNEQKALESAKQNIDFIYTVRNERKNEIVIWLENKERMPVGIIVKNTGA